MMMIHNIMNAEIRKYALKAADWRNNVVGAPSAVRVFFRLPRRYDIQQLPNGAPERDFPFHRSNSILNLISGMQNVSCLWQLVMASSLTWPYLCESTYYLYSPAYFTHGDDDDNDDA